MTNIVKSDPGGKALVRKQTEQKSLLVMLGNVTDKINGRDSLICRISCEEKVIRDISEIELNNNITGLIGKLTLIVKLIGLVERPSALELTSIFAFIVNFYNDLTLSEIVKAFEFAFTGELDEYLPKDKHGKPDSEHYQQFGVKYVGRILTAYRKRKGKAISNVWKNQPLKDKEYTEEELKEGSEYWLKT